MNDKMIAYCLLKFPAYVQTDMEISIEEFDRLRKLQDEGKLDELAQELVKLVDTSDPVIVVEEAKVETFERFYKGKETPSLWGLDEFKPSPTSEFDRYKTSGKPVTAIQTLEMLEAEGERRIGNFFLRQTLFKQVKENMEIKLGKEIPEKSVESFLAANTDLLGRIVGYDEVATDERYEIWERCESL